MCKLWKATNALVSLSLYEPQFSKNLQGIYQHKTASLDKTKMEVDHLLFLYLTVDHKMHLGEHRQDIYILLSLPLYLTCREKLFLKIEGCIWSSWLVNCDWCFCCGSSNPLSYEPPKACFYSQLELFPYWEGVCTIALLWVLLQLILPENRGVKRKACRLNVGPRSNLHCPLLLGSLSMINWTGSYLENMNTFSLLSFASA